MVQTVTSHDYPDLGTFEAHSVLTCRLKMMGRVVQCTKGFSDEYEDENGGEEGDTRWIFGNDEYPD